MRVATPWLLLVAALMAYSLLEVCATQQAEAQTPVDIPLPTPGLRVKLTWPTGTDIEHCYLMPVAQTPIGTVASADHAAAGAVVTLPQLSIRCDACAGTECSALSPNAVQIFPLDRGDVDGDGDCDVSDIVELHPLIFSGGCK